MPTTTCFYIDENVVLHFIPFDTDNTLGTSLIVPDVGEQDPFEFGLPANAPPLVSKVLAVERFRQEFAGYLSELVEGSDLMVQDYAVEWIQHAHTLIEDHLDNVTGDNERIIDRPATWANQDDYRLFELDTGKKLVCNPTGKGTGGCGCPPIADAGADITVNVGQSFQLDASNSSDPNGSIVSFHWSNDMSGATPSLSFSSTQTVTLTLTVTDNDGLTSTDEVTITVRAVEIPDVEINGIGGGALGWHLFWLPIMLVGAEKKAQPSVEHLTYFCFYPTR